MPAQARRQLRPRRLRSRRLRPGARAALVTAVTAVVLSVTATACSSGDRPAPKTATPTAAKAATARVPIHECQTIPDDGRIYRSGSKLDFKRGSMLVAIPKNRASHRPPTTGTPGPTQTLPTNVVPQTPQFPQQAPAPQYPHFPPAGHDRTRKHRVVPVTNAPAAPTDDEECISLRKWGRASPEVPPDGLLFTFRGAGTDGAQISFPAVSLTGGVLPPVGPNHPKVGPLVESFPADIGISLGGKYYLAVGCPLKVVAMSSRRAAGHFTCTNAIPMRENPLAPDEAETDLDDGTDTTPPERPAPPPGQPVAAPDAIRISGWFEVNP